MSVSSPAARFAQREAAAAPQRMLERLQNVFETNVFDTSGANADVLKLLLTCCKALITTSLEQGSAVRRLLAEADTAAVLRAKVERADAAARATEEMAQRVSFLWASQGLGDFALESHGRVAAQPQTALSAAPPAHLTMAAPMASCPPQPQPHRAQYQQHSGANAPPAVASVPVAAAASAGVGESTMQQLEVEDALRKSLETSARLDGHIAAMAAEAKTAEVHDRLSLVERAAEGLYRTSCRAQTEAARVADAAGRLDQQQRALEHRLTIHGDLLQKMGEASAKQEAGLRTALDAAKARIGELETAGKDLRAQLQTVGSLAQAHTAELASLRDTKLTAADVRGVVARGVAAATQPLVDDLDALRCVLDLPREEIQRATVGLQQQQQPHQRSGSQTTLGTAPSTPRGASASAAAAAARPKAAAAAAVPGSADPQLCLKVVHASLPFKTLLGAIQRVSDAVRTVRDQQQAMLSRTKPQPPLIGLELADSVEGAVVARVFPALPAAAAGLKPGDIVIAVQGTTIRSREDFSEAFAHIVGQGGLQDGKVPIHVRRGMKLHELNMAL